MFSSNRRRASTVSDVLDNDEDGPLLAGMAVHPIATNIATTSQTDENRVDAIHLCGKCPRNLNRRRRNWRLRFPLLADDPLEDLHAAYQIVPIHHERRKDAECVFSGCKREQTFVPPALHDLVR